MIKKSNTYYLRLLAIITISLDAVLAILFFSFYNYYQSNAGDFRFENLNLLYLLILVPLFSLLFINHQFWKSKRIEEFGDELLISTSFDTGKYSLALVKHIIQKMALLLLIISLANPQYGKSKITLTAQGVDIMIALDVSNSMLAEDMSGSVQRLKMAKLAIEKLIYQLQGDRIGIVVFAANAYKQLPITNDYEMAMMYLGGVSPGMLSNQGTAIGTAIDSCITSFKTDTPTSKTIIVISDGENHEDDAIIASKKALSKNIIVNTIGIGSKEGSTIPVFENGKKNGVKRDSDGKPVITKMNPELMQNIANAGGGIYKYGEGSDLGLSEILANVNQMEKVKTIDEKYSDFEDHFQFYLFLAFILVILDHLLLNSKSTWPGKYF